MIKGLISLPTNESCKTVDCLLTAVSAIESSSSEDNEAINNVACENCQSVNRMKKFVRIRKNVLRKLDKEGRKKLIQDEEIFNRLESNRQNLLLDLMEVILMQKEALNKIDYLLNATQNKDLIPNQDIDNLKNIITFYFDMRQTLGGVIKDPESEYFLTFAKDARNGVKTSMRNVIKMITSSSFWKENSHLCSKMNERYFLNLLLSSFLLRIVAFGMDGYSMTVREVDQFQSDIQTIHNEFEASCGCPDKWTRRNDYCYFILGADVPNEPQFNNRSQCVDGCSQIGGSLASIHSEEENSFIFGLLGGLYRGPPFRPTLLGGNAVELRCASVCERAIVDHWADKSDYNFTKWDQGQPGDGNWGCMFIGYYNSGPFWNSASCYPDINCQDCYPKKFDCACKRPAYS